MPGRLNSNKDGLYVNTQLIIKHRHVCVGQTSALQSQMIPKVKAYFENHVIDTKNAVHRSTQSEPQKPGAQSGTVNGLAKAVLGSSRIFKVNASAVNHSGTIKSQNAGNCPFSPMAQATSATCYFYVGG